MTVPTNKHPSLPTEPGGAEPAPDLARPRSRRALLAGLAGGAGALIANAVGRVNPIRAAAGDPIVMGQNNLAGGKNTQLTTSTSGRAFEVIQNGSGAAIRGKGLSGNGGNFVTAAWDKFAFMAQHDGTGTGSGGAISARGKHNHGVVASTDQATRTAISASNSDTANANGNVAVSGLAYGGNVIDVHPSGSWYKAAGEFAGANGVIGAASALKSGGYGVLGLTSGTSGHAVHGHARATSGAAYGIYGQSDSNAGYGVFGRAISGGAVTTYGVYGQNASDYGAAVFGQATSTNGSPAGVLGTAANGRGVMGTSQAGTALWGETSSGTGVFGTSTDGKGVYGFSMNSYAGYFDGSLYAASANAAVKAFRIDHPLDPANKVLMHSSVESNERKLVYDGVVTTDANGEATVTLPDWFDALNTDVRYQLTVIGSFVQAIVKSEVENNRFVIASSAPNTKVSWQVTGVRKDAFATAHPLVVESAKTGRERGKYLNPVEHGQPESAGVTYELREQAKAMTGLTHELPGPANAEPVQK